MAECGRWRWAGLFCFWLLLFESGFSGTVEISWRKNRESDHHGYRIHYGTLARKYTFHRDVGDTTHCTIEGLEKEVEYFFAVTAYDSAQNESAYSEEVSCILKDTRPLALANATLLNPTILALEFNKKIARTTAAELTNYTIDQNIQLLSATLLSDGKNVHLKTSEHRPGQKYTLTITKIQDISHPANTIADSTVITYDYTGAPGDQTGPVPLLVNVNDSGHIEILFNEAINPETAETESNYQILDQYHNTLPIYQAFRSETDPNLVHIHTAMHHAGVVYGVSCTGIQDRFGNQIKNDGRISYQYKPLDLLGPTVRVINAIDPTQIDILFNEKVDRLTAEDIANYAIDKDVMVLSASLNDSQNLVHLETSEHGIGEPYVIRITGVRDKSPQKNIIAPRSNWRYRVASADSLGPLLARVDVLDAQNIALIFNEALAPTEFESPDFYQIDHGVQVLNAFLHFDRKKIELFTSVHQPGFNYTLSLKGLRDASPNQNKILYNTTYSYCLPGDNVAPTIVQVEAKSADKVFIRFSKEMDPSLAQTVGNFRITPELVIFQAHLDPDQAMVELTTQAHQKGQIYKLQTMGLKSKSGQTLPNSTFFRYAYEPPDQVGPVIAMVRLKDATHLEVAFDEALDKIRAQMLSNYSISEGIEIYHVSLDATGMIATLETSAHLDAKHYTLSVTGVADNSPGKNPIMANSQFGYCIEDQDRTRPFIFHLNPADYNRLDVIFNEPVESASASQIENYHASPGIEIRSATPSADGYIVRLETSDHLTNRIYSLTVNGIRDLSESGNLIQPNSSMNYHYDLAASVLPQISNLIVVDERNILAVFNKKLAKSIAENAANYRLSHGGRIVSAQQLASENEVMLATTPHQRNQVYTLRVSNLAESESQGAVDTPSAPFVYPYTGRSAASSVITSVIVVDPSVLRVNFDREMDRLSAERRFNYHISNGVQVVSCQLETGSRSVRLKTSDHQSGQVYVLGVSGLRDLNNNPITGQTDAYTLFPGLELRLQSHAETELGLLELNRPYYLDRDYVITKAPQGFEFMRMVRTRNDDKEINTDAFLRLHLAQKALVYVAYDSRATAFPSWLNHKFTRTPMYLEVTDKCKRLELWGVVVPAGEILLGGNLAAGAENAKSMYLVLMTEMPANFRSIMDNPLALEEEPAANLPERVDLRQNYPNPFNPTTIIGFRVPGDCRVKIEIFNVLGEKVRTLIDNLVATGNYNIVWDGTDANGMVVAAGVYFYRLETSGPTKPGKLGKDGFVLIKKMLFLR